MIADTAPLRPLEAYRDDGALPRALGAVAGPASRVPPPAWVVAGAVPLLAILAAEGGEASHGLAGAAIGWFVAVAGLSGGRRDASAFRWLPAPLFRLTEYAAMVWLGALAGGAGVAAAFALLCALAFRHYDIPYRIRHQGAPPPRWVELAGGGWAGRLAVAYALLVLGALPAGLFAMAGVLGTLWVAESASSWARHGRTAAVADFDDAEGERA